MDPNWLRAENRKLSNADLAIKAISLLRVEAAHDTEEWGLDFVRHEMEDRGLSETYERCRQHVKHERAAGRGHIHEIDLEAIMSTTLATTTADAGDYTPAMLKSQVNLIQETMASVMIDGQHYGKIPGCGDKPTLLKPGAEKLAFLFRLALEIDEQVIDLGHGHREYRVKCRLKSIKDGSFVGEGIGCCSTMESKYRWRGGARLCPECGKACIKKSKFPPRDRPDEAPGYYCFAKIGGCGANFAADDQSILSQSEERQENPDIADCYNTCLKIAKKRASVDAVLTATAASDIFAQDLEDLHHADAPIEEPAPRQQSKPAQAPKGGQHASPPADKPKGPPPMPENGQKLYDQLDKRDQELTKAGKCQRGDLLRHVSTSGIAAGMPKNMGDWKPQHIAIAVGMAKSWIEDLGKPQPQQPDQDEGYAGQEIEEPATAG